MGIAPAAVVKTRLTPARLFLGCVIENAASQIVKPYWRLGHSEAIVRFKLKFFAVGVFTFERQRKLWCRTPRCCVKIPYFAAGCILHTVAENDTDNIHAIFQHGLNIIFIKIYNVVGVGNIGCQQPLCYLRAINEKLVKAQARYCQASGIEGLFNAELFSQKRCGNMLCISRILITCRNKAV